MPPIQPLDWRDFPKNQEQWLRLYKIKSKGKVTIPFVLNRVQREIQRKLQGLELSGKPKRLIVLKPRQIGCTTFFGIHALNQAYWKPNQFAAIVAHKSESVQTIFGEIIKFAYDNLPEIIKFKAYNDSAHQIAWKSMASQIKVAADGHGITPNILHLTEVARIDGAKEMIGEALQGVPRNGLVVQESTANGAGGYFYDAWNEAQDDVNAIWYPIFLKWWHMEEYCLPSLASIELTDEEKLLKQGFHELNDGHILWRREKIREMGGERVDVETGLSGKMLFQQNYPMSPAEAFIVRSGSLFDVAALHEMLMTCPQPLSIQQVGTGTMRIFAEVGPHEYLIACDPSYGEAGDFSAATVFRRDNRQIVTTLHGKYIPRVLAGHLAKLGNFYRGAVIAVERNSGHAVLNELINHLDYNRVYHHLEYDERRNSRHSPGFPTTAITRNLFLASLEDAIATKSLIIPDEGYIRECINFGNRGGKWQATTGNDDRVMSLAIGNYLCVQNASSLEPPRILLKPAGV